MKTIFPNPRVGFCAGLVLSTLMAFDIAASAREGGPRLLSSHRAAEEYRAQALRDENGLIPDNALLNALQQKQNMPFNPAVWPASVKVTGRNGRYVAELSTNNWTWLGPGNIGGRLRSILVHPTNTNILWVGSVCGGVWKTANAGAGWFPCNDFMGNLAIGCLALDPLNPDVLYAGTGEGFGNGDSLRGEGIFKSSDGGTNWLQLPGTATSSFYYVNRLAISPTNNQVLLAATGSGIWRSTDGGTNWNQTYSANGMLWIGFHPTDGTLCLAAGTSVALYSTDGGLTWNESTGLASSGRIELAYSRSSPDIVYASQNNNEGEIYVSNDGGVTYSLVNTGTQYLGGQGWYDNAIWVDPTNPNVLVVGGLDLWRSTDGGISLIDIGGYSGGAHPDQHAIVQSPSYDGTSVRTVFVGDDGGIYRATDIYTVSGFSGWTDLNNNLGVTEFYGAAGNASSGTIVGGTQDNGTLRYTPTGGPQAWTDMFGGDGGFCASDPTDPNYFYGEYVYLQITRSTDGGASSSYITSGLGDAGIANGADPDDPDAEVSANFIAPFILDPNNPDTMLAGGSNLWRSVNVKAPTPAWIVIKPGGNGSFISAIAVAPGNSDIIWVGYNNGDVYSTTNGTDASPIWSRQDLGTPNLPDRKCLRLSVDPGDSNRVYACFGGFSSDNTWKTEDGGATWSSIGTSLPATPVHSLVIAPFNSQFIYVGTEVGVFGSADGGETWSPSNQGAANVAVDELFWMGDYLVAACQGRGLFKILISPNPIITLSAMNLAAESFQPTNGAVDPGERVTFDVSLVNIAAVPTTNLTATLLAAVGVSFPSGPQDYGSLVLGGGAVARPFSFTATGMCGGSNVLTFQLSDGTNNLGFITRAISLGQPVLSLAENFDSVVAPALPDGWTTAVSGSGAPWTTSTLTDHSSPNSVYGGEPVLPGIGELISPPIAMTSGSAQLSFLQFYNMEADPVDTTEAYDGGVLEIQIGSGAFTDILEAGGSFASGGYTRTIDPTDDNALGSRQVWSGAVADFVSTVVNLPVSAVGQTVQFKWRLGTDTENGYGGTGWYIDDVAISLGYNCASGPPVIQSIAWSNSAVSVTWSGTSGQSYRLQSSTDLTTTNWLDVGGDVLAESAMASVTNVPAPATQTFYRIRTVP